MTDAILRVMGRQGVMDATTRHGGYSYAKTWFSSTVKHGLEGPSFLRRMIDLSAVPKELNQHFRADLQWWAVFLED